MSVMPFCVLKKPYMVWGQNLPAENSLFLEGFDADLYFRTAHSFVALLDTPSGCQEQADASPGDFNDQSRKDVSSLSRLLWHHGVETLVMLLGAYIQAPGGVQAYFLKCKTEDAVELGRLLLAGELPKYNRLHGGTFSLLNLMLGIHGSASWPGSETASVVERFSKVLTNMLDAYTSQQHRSEYNSIKHGLRASHGSFSLAVGRQESLGRAAPREAMQTIGYSKDASFFRIVKPLGNATKEQSKLHFTMNSVSLSWSLEKVLMELQLLSLLIGNTISALRIANGASPQAVKFNKVADDAEFWVGYDRLQPSGVSNSSFGPAIDAQELSLPTAEDIFRSYRA